MLCVQPEEVEKLINFHTSEFCTNAAFKRLFHVRIQTTMFTVAKSMQTVSWAIVLEVQHPETEIYCHVYQSDEVFLSFLRPEPSHLDQQTRLDHRTRHHQLAQAQLRPAGPHCCNCPPKVLKWFHLVANLWLHIYRRSRSSSNGEGSCSWRGGWHEGQSIVSNLRPAPAYDDAFLSLFPLLLQHDTSLVLEPEEWRLLAVAADQ